MSTILFRNSTELSDSTLIGLFNEGISGWSTGTIDLRVRYSRGADFSGACYYRDQKILINLGRHLKYPYLMSTNLARAKVIGRRWYRELYTLEMADGYQVVLFIFMHELFHLLIKRARRNRRQKESMCDRFAAALLIEKFGCIVRDKNGVPVPREDWDFQDLHGFVARARIKERPRVAKPKIAALRPSKPLPKLFEQLTLFW